MIIVFKLILLAALGWIGYLFFFRVRSPLLNRLFVLLAGLSVAVFVIVPDLSTRTAEFFGIGRGTDFVLYVSQVFIYLLLVLQYLKVQSLKDELTRVVRNDAVREAKPPQP